MTERQKLKICKKAIKHGFYGSIWGTFTNSLPTSEEIEFIKLDKLEVIYYIGGEVAGIAVPSPMSSEGYLYL